MDFISVKEKLKSLYLRFDVLVFKKTELKNHVLVKYLFKDLFLYFFVSFLFFFMIFFVNQILLTVEDLLSKSAPFKDVMRIMWYSLPFVIAQSAPYATLVGFLMSLGGMMSNNEILIFRAAGFSFFRILFPVVLMGLFISVASFFVNDYLLPLGTIKYNQLIREIMQSTPTVELESNSVKELDNSYVVMGDVKDKAVSDIILFDNSGDTDKIIIAGNSTLDGNVEEGILMRLKMNNALILNLNSKNLNNYEVLDCETATLNFFDSAIMGRSGKSAREMTTYDLGKHIKKMKSESDVPVKQNRRLKLWYLEYHKKFAIPFGSIFFAFLAFSIALLFGKHNGQTIGLFVGIVICVLNWAMQISGQLFVQRLGLDPFWCIWLPNFVIGILGTVLLLVLIKK